MLATLLRGQHFKPTESAFHDLQDWEYIGSEVEDKTCICIGHDNEGDSVCISLAHFKPEMLELDSEAVNHMAWKDESVFWISDEEIEVKL